MSDARRIGTLALIEEGVWLYSRDRRTGRDDLPIGGAVVAIEDAPDPETGEVVRWYTTVEGRRDTLNNLPVTVRRLAESELSEFGVEAPTEGRMRHLIRRLWTEAGAAKGPILPRHVQWGAWAQLLASKVTGRR